MVHTTVLPYVVAEISQIHEDSVGVETEWQKLCTQTLQLQVLQKVAVSVYSSQCHGSCSGLPQTVDCECCTFNQGTCKIYLFNCA